MTLKEYRRKRNFRKTSEPASGRGTAVRGKLRYVIQKHAASRLHYDFRLELDGALKSWAVPKGPSLDPQKKQLAVHVEDHPVAYGDFEGIIPPGEYGGGTVMVWDQGTWEPKGDAHRGYREGKLKFTLHGRRLKGDWMLVEMHGDAGADGKNWLLIKEHDPQERSESDYKITAEETRSVVTRRSMDEIAASSDRVWSSSKSRTATSKAKVSSAAKKSLPTGSRGHNGRPSSGQSRSSRGKAVEKSSPLKDLKNQVAELTGAHRAKLPSHLSPQLATLVTRAPRGDDWLHEMKFDGYRLLAFREGSKTRLITRKGNDWTSRFSSVAEEVSRIQADQTIFDGEVVILNSRGIPDFQLLQNQLKSPQHAEFIFYIFDLPYCFGFDLRAVPLISRKEILQQLLRKISPDNDGILRYSDHILGLGSEVAEQSCLHQMEGILSKRVQSPYESGRTSSWVKVKCHHRQEFVIGGYTKPSGARHGFGSLLLGYYDRGKLVYSGRVGTGFTAKSLRDVMQRLQPLEINENPFVAVPRDAERQLASWVKPELVGEVEFTEWTSDKVLRHPSFKGLRDDKPARKIIREQPQPVTKVTSRPPARPVNSEKQTGLARSARSLKSSRGKKGPDTVMIAHVTMTSPDRIIDSVTGDTKADVARFYEEMADWILPHLEDRPISLVRCPEGLGGECFYQKHLDGELPGIEAVTIQEKSKADNYAVVKNVTGLVTLVQWGMLEIHPWQGRTDDLEHSDRMIFDLDPGEGVDWSQIVEGAREIRTRLEDLGLQSFLRTSGGKGLHLVVPLTRRRTFDEVKDFSHAIATCMRQDAPDRYIDTMSKSKRSGRIFVDYLRNGRGATAIASYSTRARPGLAVATPLRWDELTLTLRPDQYSVKNIQQRLHSLKNDPWEGFFELQQTITKPMLRRLKCQR